MENGEFMKTFWEAYEAYAAGDEKCVGPFRDAHECPIHRPSQGDGFMGPVSSGSISQKDVESLIWQRGFDAAKAKLSDVLSSVDLRDSEVRIALYNALDRQGLL